MRDKLSKEKISQTDLKYHQQHLSWGNSNINRERWGNGSHNGSKVNINSGYHQKKNFKEKKHCATEHKTQQQQIDENNSIRSTLTKKIPNKDHPQAQQVPNDSSSNENIIKYLNVDIQQLYKQQLPNPQPQHKPPQKQAQITVINIDQQQNPCDKKQKKYIQQIQHYKKSNIKIHNQIINIYLHFNNHNHKTICKNIQHMKVIDDKLQLPKIYQQGKSKCQDKISKCYSYDQQNYLKRKYKQQKISGYNQGKSKDFNASKQYLIDRNKILKKLRYESMHRKTNQKVDESKISFPKLVNRRYQNFYQDLYRLNKEKEKVGDKKDENKKQQENKQIENYQQFKNVMVNYYNNIGKNFQEFLVKKNIRIPEFLKNIK